MATLTVDAPKNSLDIKGVATIKAPLEKVFEAYSNKDLFVKWFCRGNEVNVKQFECVSGGAWDIEERDPNTKEEWGFYGIFHEVAINERIVWTFEFMGMPERGHVTLEKMDFVAVDDKLTEMHSTTVFLTQEDRQGMLESGLEDGWRQSIEALGEVIGES